MISYIIRRLIVMIPILFGVSVLVFVLFSAFGEDPVRIALGSHATPESISELRHMWGLDKPLWHQYLDFLRQIVTADFGRSFNSGEKISELFLKGGLVSLSLTAPPFFFGIMIYVSISVLIAYFRGSWFDRCSRFITIGMMSVSYLVYIIGFQYLLAYKWGLFPINGYTPGWEAITYLMLPWIIFVVVASGEDIRMYRTIFLDEVKSDYVRTARAKGATEKTVLFKHVLKNAMIPILTYTVVLVPFLILGAFLMERFFSIPGVGDLMIGAINDGDFPILKALTMYIAIAYSIFNLITDILYAYVDPRVELR